MFKLLVLAVALVACVSCAPADNKESCVGCPVDHDVNDPELMPKVRAALAKANRNPRMVKKILSYQTQIVAGVHYSVKYEATDGKKCTLGWVEQPWISKEPQYVKHHC